MASMIQTRMPRFMTINQAAQESEGRIPAHAIRQMVKDGTLPTRIIKAGNKVLLNYDLLVQNLSRINSEEGEVQ